MISIIIPTLNEEEYLPHLLESIEKQDFDGYEIIVADAGSEDKTRKIAEKYDCKIIKGGLPSEGRNKGAEVAQGDLLLFVDADSILPADFLSKVVKEFEGRELDVATTAFSFYDRGKFINFLANLFYNWPILLLEKILPHAPSLVLAKPKVHEEIGGFDEEVTIAEDHHYVREATKNNRFGILRSTKFRDTVRRFEKDGYLSTYFKYLIVELHMIFKGPVKGGKFNYDFEHGS